jgi:hypothetical protein
LREAYLQGRLLSAASPLRVAIRELARKLAGIKDAEQEQRPRRWSLPGFRGRRRIEAGETGTHEPATDLVASGRN